uniref:IgGFc-binding protein N-terminal domain-containing protein n=1 Tax=Plectus sambesii TaxID=2011161 RepID=A0A914VH63_9BILA
MAHAKLVTGTEFVFALPASGGDSTMNSNLIVNNQNNATAVLTLLTNLFNTTSFNVPANSIQRIQIPTNISASLGDLGYNTVADKGVTVRSTNPITLYVAMESTDTQYSTQFLVLPTNRLGTQYNYLTSLLNYKALIIATQDNTHFTIGTTGQTLTLNKMQTYFTGTAFFLNSKMKSISANAPFASILYGSSSSPTTAVMSLPSSYSSTGFPVVFSDGNSGAVTFFALYNNTSITYNSNQNIILNAGESQEVRTPTTWINASQPIQVIFDPENTGHFGYAIAPENYLSTSIQFYQFLGSTSMSILTSLQSVGKIAFDNQVIPALQFRHIPFTTYYYYVSYVEPALLHTIRPTEQGVSYLATVYNEQQWGSAYVVNFDMST